MKFNNRVREIRKLRKISIQELADKLGEPYSSVQKIDAGTVDLDTSWMSRLSKVLNVEPYELLPLEWQPKQITPQEREILNMIRKTKEPDNSQSDNTKAS